MDELDRILDEAFVSYANAPLSHGLEKRILRHLRRPESRGRWWILAGVSFACLAIMASFVRMPKLAQLPVARLASPPVPAFIVPVVPVRQFRSRRRRSLAPEESLLVFLDRHPEVSESILEQRDPNDIPPIGIEPLKFKELQ